MKHLILLFAWLPCIGAPVGGAQSERIEHLRFERTPLPEAVAALARQSRTTIITEAGITDEVTLEIHDMPVRIALATLVAPAGHHLEETSAGIVIRRLKTVLYSVDYPQLNRSGSGSASITLGGANGASGAIQQNAAGSSSGQSASDTTQVSIQQENQGTFWTTLEAELRSMLREGESLVVNRFSGIVQVTASARRHEVIREFLAVTGQRVTQQVEIEAQLVEVTLRDDSKLGIDWALAARRLDATAPLDVTGVGGSVFRPATLVSNLGFRHATAAIHALQEQGEVKTVSQPRLRALNNQSAFIKIGEDRPFFRLQQSTSISQPGTSLPFSQTQDSFTVSTITIGTILAITPQVGADRIITLDVLPAITRLQAVVTSPDGRQTAPVTEVKQASTIVRLKDGETAMIGGLISDATGRTERSVPLLSRLPILGPAFRSKGGTKARTELVILLTPRLVRP